MLSFVFLVVALLAVTFLYVMLVVGLISVAALMAIPFEIVSYVMMVGAIFLLIRLAWKKSRQGYEIDPSEDLKLPLIMVLIALALFLIGPLLSGVPLTSLF